MRYLLRMIFVAGVVVPVMTYAQEKSITIEQALAIAQSYYEHDIEADQDYWLLTERTAQWEIFVDEEPSANWMHDCTIYKFPNTGDLAVDMVPEIIKPQPRIFPNESLQLLSMSVIVSKVYPGYVAGSAWTNCH